jgi:DNA-binding GntR family transcriptional regulator
MDVGLASAVATAEHLDLVAAIEAHDADLAHRVMNDQIAGTADRIIQTAISAETLALKHQSEV